MSGNAARGETHRFGRRFRGLQWRLTLSYTLVTLLPILALEAMAARPSSVDLLPQITVPTLVIAGHDDLIVPLEASESMARAIPKARLVVIPDAGHSAPIEQPEAVNAAVREFLAALER